MLTKLDSYICFRKEVDHIIKMSDSYVSDIYDMDRDIDDILRVAKEQNVPGIDPAEQSIHALLLSIMANIKANRAHYIALRARIDALNDFANLSHFS